MKVNDLALIAQIGLADQVFEDATEKYIGDITFYHFNEILSGTWFHGCIRATETDCRTRATGACAAVASLSALFLIMLHATHFSNPSEQWK